MVQEGPYLLLDEVTLFERRTRARTAWCCLDLVYESFDSQRSWSAPLVSIAERQ